MKKCASCTKDLPDAALHCVFCGAKQPPAPAAQQAATARTAYGYSANDVQEQLKQQGTARTLLAAQPVSPPQPSPQRGGPPPGMPPYMGPPGNPPAHMFNQQPPPYSAPPSPPPPTAVPHSPPPPTFNPPPPQAPYQPPQPYNPAAAATTLAPPSAYGPGPAVPQAARSALANNPTYAGGPQGNFVPAAPANAATMFVPGPGPQPQPQPSGQPQAPYPRHPPTPMQAPTMVAPLAQPQPVASTKPLTQPQTPIISIPKAQPPPYLASQSAARTGRLIEPWKDSLRLMMFLWGVGLLVVFVTPLSTSPMVFGWTAILEGEGTAKLPPLMIIAIGVLSVVVASIPMQPAARGFIAAVLGLAGVIVPIALVGMPPARALLTLVATLLLVPGLLLRSEYRHETLPRVLVTVGALGILVPYLVPVQGTIPLIGAVQLLSDASGAQKLVPALILGQGLIVLLSLLCWLPGPGTGGAKLWAWLLILWALISQMLLLFLVGGAVGEAIKSAPNDTLVSWIASGDSPAGVAIGSAYLVLIGYGGASVVGKQLE